MIIDPRFWAESLVFYYCFNSDLTQCYSQTQQHRPAREIFVIMRVSFLIYRNSYYTDPPQSTYLPRCTGMLHFNLYVTAQQAHRLTKPCILTVAVPCRRGIAEGPMHKQVVRCHVYCCWLSQLLLLPRASLFLFSLCPELYPKARCLGSSLVSSGFLRIVSYKVLASFL